MKTILLIGAGKSASVCIDFLGEKSADKSFQFIVADSNLEVLKLKTASHPHIVCTALDINNATERFTLIKEADVVISMLPATLHFLVAKDCVAAGVNLLTASYLDEAMKSLEPEIIEKDLLFICELGLDPGIDHMSAMQLFENIKSEGGEIVSFKSHCGGLVAPESDDNPWHYKISWNPANVVNAGKSGAVFLQNENKIILKYEDLFSKLPVVNIDEDAIGCLSYYPNRDSLSYIDLYNLHTAKTFLRTTLRHPDFMKGWNAIVQLHLTETEHIYETENLSVKEFYDLHINKHGLEALNKGLLENYKIRILFEFLGFFDEDLILNIGIVNTVTILQHLLEQKLKLESKDKDMIVMVHEIAYIKDKQNKSISSTLIVKGIDSVHTAMAKTVGLPLALTAILLLDGKINLTGLHIPIRKEIYKPILKKLSENGISFTEKYI